MDTKSKRIDHFARDLSVELPSELQICPGQGLTPLKDAEGREIIRCGVDSFGAGGRHPRPLLDNQPVGAKFPTFSHLGTNAHVILETYPGSTGPIGAIDMGYNLKWVLCRCERAGVELNLRHDPLQTSLNDSTKGPVLPHAAGRRVGKGGNQRTNVIDLSDPRADS